MPAQRGEDAAGTVVERTFVFKRRMMDERWDMVKVTRRGVAEIGEVALVEGRKSGFAVEVR